MTDSVTGKPIANVAVTAKSPSGTYSAVTDAKGFYSMTGVAPDSYTVSFQAAGYDPTVVLGIGAFADQFASASATMVKSLRNIANVTAHVQNGAFQPGQTADTYTVDQKQLQNIQGNSLNTSVANLIKSLPGGSSTTGNLPSIRGGRSNNVDYEFEGMNFTDPYNNLAINNYTIPTVALQQVQLTPGSANASFGNSGVGTINLIARRGTFPGTFEGTLGLGGVGFYHGLSFGTGLATRNGRISDFLSYTANNNWPEYGGSLTADATQYGTLNQTAGKIDRELTNNFVLKLGKRSQYSLQFFVDNGMYKQVAGYGQSYKNDCFVSCSKYWQGVFSPILPTMETFQRYQYLYPGQTDPNETLGQAGRPSYQQFEVSNGTKVQFDWNVNPSTYFFVNYYNAFGVTDEDDAIGNAGVNRVEGGWNASVNFGLNKQLSDKNFLAIGGSPYIHLTPVYTYDSPPDEFFNLWFDPGGYEPIYDFINPTDPNCAIGPGGCGYLYKSFPNAQTIKVLVGSGAATLQPRGFNAFVNDTWTPNDKLKVDVGLRLDAQDVIMPQQGVLPDCTFHYLPTTFQSPDSNGLINGKPMGPGNCPAATFAPITRDTSNPRVLQPRIGFSYRLGLNDSIRASFGRTVRFPHGSYSDANAPLDYGSQFAGIAPFVNPVIIASGGGAQGAYGPGNYYDTHNVMLDCGFADITGYSVPCTSYQEMLYWSIINGDYAFALNPLKPITYNNWDASYEHQFKRGWAVKFSGYARRAYDLDVNNTVPRPNATPIPIPGGGTYIPNYGYNVATNDGIEIADGLELDITKSAPFGLTGMFALTYQNVRQNVAPGYGYSSQDEFSGSIPSFGSTTLYRVNYVTPLSAALNLAYTTHNGWRIANTWFYDVGYPYGEGQFVYHNFNHQGLLIPNSNSCGGSHTQYVDPTDPGSCLAPNIAATAGIKLGKFTNSLLTHPNLVSNITIEKTVGRSTSLGVTVSNIFNEVYTGPTLVEGPEYGRFASGNIQPCCTSGQTGSPGLTSSNFGYNSRYQPVATGVSGPLTGIYRQLLINPNGGFDWGDLVNPGRGIFTHWPNGTGRSFYFYLTFKNL